MGASGRLGETGAPEGAPVNWSELAAAVRDIGPDVSPATIVASGSLLAPWHLAGEAGDASAEQIDVRRDVAYGPAPEHLLDVYAPHGEDATGVVIYVHGGAFVGGAKSRDGSPYHANIAKWAAASGRIGVIMNHRLAPEHSWPAGAEDVAAAVAWCRENLVTSTGAPLPVHLVGNSSGAVHTATYVVGGPDLAAAATPPASMSLVSGVYDLPSFGAARLGPYVGDIPLTEWQTAERLAECDTPLLFAVGEYDTPEAFTQYLNAASVFAEHRGTLPHMVRARAGNHFTTVNAVGTPFDDLGPALAAFMTEVEESAEPENG